MHCAHGFIINQENKAVNITATHQNQLKHYTYRQLAIRIRGKILEPKLEPKKWAKPIETALQLVPKTYEPLIPRKWQTQEHRQANKSRLNKKRYTVTCYLKAAALFLTALERPVRQRSTRLCFNLYQYVVYVGVSPNLSAMLWVSTSIT